MNVNLATGPMLGMIDYKHELTVMKRAIAKRPKDRETALKWLASTGMYTKTGKLKKQFR